MRRALGIGWVVLLGCGGTPPVPLAGTSTVRTLSGPTQFNSRSAALFFFSTELNGAPVTSMSILVHEADVACHGGSTAPISRWFYLGTNRIAPHTFGPGEYRSEPV